MLTLDERVDTVEGRVESLEEIFGRFMVETGITIRRMDRILERLDRTAAEMRSDGERRREETDRTIAGIRADGERHREKIDQMISEIRADGARDRREWNKRWGELANKQGTLVEDIVAPSLRRMGEEELGCGPMVLFTERTWRRRSDDPSRGREFDALYVGERAVLLNETKSTAKPEYAQEFVAFLHTGEFALYFPEYADKPIVPVFSSLHLPDNIITYLTRHDIYAVGMGEEAMAVLNLEEVRRSQEV